MDYKKYLKKHKCVVLLIGLLAFFIRAIPHQYIIPFTGRGNRVLYGNYAIVDIWEGDPNWVVVYENEGGKIYE